MPGETRSAERLYQGEAWTQVPRLAASAESAGYQVRVLVVSAGLGLHTLDAELPGYAATFSPGSPDTVAPREDLCEWWENLGRSGGAQLSLGEMRGPVLLVLSEPYATALRRDLIRLGDRGDDVLLVGGATEIPGVVRIPADKGLRPVLGGTTATLNVRTAVAWIERLGGKPLVSRAARAAWAGWAGQVRRMEVWNRAPMTDTEVRAFIGKLRADEPSISCTRALRALRDSQRACEQRRFANLFANVVSES